MTATIKMCARAGLTCAALSLPGTALAQDGASANLYGMPGLIDMPSAQSFEDADLATTYSWFSGTHKTTLAFQITPRLTGSFRYAVIGGWLAPGDPLFEAYNGNQYDRSFDLHFRLLDEGKYIPSVAVGLRDFMGTGLLSGEYIVASKQITSSLGVTGGLGWGRLSNSSEVHTGETTTGGVPNFGQWFRGSVGVFGGIEWRTPVKGLSFKAEYSSDQYFQETQDPARPAPIFDRKTPYNFGLEYSPRDNLRMGVYHMYGSQVAFRLTARLNPKRNPHGGTLEGAPLPVISRAPATWRDTNWLNTPDIETKGREQLDEVMTRQGLKVEALNLSARQGNLWFRNKSYEAAPQAFGRAARAMAYVMPDSVDIFRLTLVEDGIPVSTMTLRRADLEALEHDPRGTEKMLAAVDVEGGIAMPSTGRDPALYPDFRWSVGPYVGVSLFDPTNPVRADLGLRATGEFTISPGLSLSGSVTKKIVGNRGAGPAGTLGPAARAVRRRAILRRGGPGAGAADA
ncbi:YjbH domain-containing protein [Halovulum sp. GXIMD14793]